MASNTSTITDNTGNFSDWFEIYNSSSSPADLSNYYVSDLKTNLIKFKFTSLAGQVVVPANGFLIIWASDNITAGNTHTNFSLSSTNGEAVYLTAPNGTTILDSLVFPSQRDNVSYGRLNDGNSTIRYFSPSSPNASNNPTFAYDGFLTSPIFSKTGGFFNSPFQLTLSHPESGVSIYYTTDGSDPSPTNLGSTGYNYKNNYPQNPENPVSGFFFRSYKSNAYTLPISVQDKTNTPNEISMISSTFHYIPTYLPEYYIKKGTVIRAIAIKQGYLPSDIKTHTYLYSSTGLNPYSMPVVSVAIQENRLFEYNLGIYNAGVTFENFRSANPTIPADVCTPGNWTNEGSAWERLGNFEFMETQNVVVNQALGMRIHGSCSASAPYKSLRFYGKNKFDGYAFFPNYPTLKHDRIILRNGGNDYNQTMFKDVFVQAWMSHLNFASQKSRPSIMFINGEYWGVHDLRERIDKYYLNALFGVDPNNIDLRKVVWDTPDEIEEGDSLHYTNMYNFITTNDMSLSENYAQVKQMLDPSSLIDYEIAEIFIGNMDWPQNNVRLWRTKNSYNPLAEYGKDGRWRWILYDTDRSLGELVNAQSTDLEMLTDRPDNILFKKLLNNTEFRTDFVNRYADLLNSSLKSSYSLPIFNGLKTQYSPEIQNHIDRWENLSDVTAWDSQCNIVRNYLTQRPNEMLIQLKDYFDLTGDFLLTVTTSDTTKGFVKVNSLPIKSSTKGLPSNLISWTGLYFDNLPLNITASPKTGYKFSYWIYNGAQIFDSTITVTTSANRTYAAFFEPAIISNNPIPATGAEIVKCGYSVTEWSSSSAIGSSPPNSKFVYLSEENPTLSSTIAGFTSGAYNLTSATRINGLGTNGFSFINTGSGNTGYPGVKLGGFLLAINTMNLDTIKLSWTGKTITANPRKYRIRLFYREGDLQAFQEFSPTIEYVGNTSSGHSQTFSDIVLPSSIMNKQYVQLFWKYYYSGPGTSGARDELAIDDITIKGINTYSGTLISINNPDINPNKIYTTGKLNNGIIVTNSAKDAIILNPGFEAKPGSVFKAEIKNCN